MQLRTVIARSMRCLLLAVCVLTFEGPGNLHAAPADCEPIGRARDSQHDRLWPRVTTVTRAGRYCLTQDIESKTIFDFSSGGSADSMMPMWVVEAGATRIDLQWHKLSSNQPYEMISIRSTDISIANGVIHSVGGSGIGMYGYRFTSLRNDYVLRDAKLSDSAYLEEVGTVSGEKRRSFARAGLKVDHIEIDAGSRAVHPKRRPSVIGMAFQGSHNSITNSRITIRSGHAAIYLFGSNQRIEGNTIVFKCPGATPSAAPIKLHAADNSIIRNNTIVVDCWSTRPQAAISLIDSRNVVIENNRIIGVKQLYKVWDERPEQRSSVVDRGNTFPTLWDRILGR